MNYEQHFIGGFVKQAVARGFAVEKVVEILKQAEFPFRQQEAAKVRGYDEAIEANEYNRANHPYHYALNPFVEGPIAEIKNRVLRRVHTSHVKSPLSAGAGLLDFPFGDVGITGLAKLHYAGKEEKQKAREFRPTKDKRKKDVKEDKKN